MSDKSVHLTENEAGIARAQARNRLREIVNRQLPADTVDDFLSEGSGPNWAHLPEPMRPSQVLAAAMVRDAMNASDIARLAEPAGLAVVVAVPGPDWVIPIERAMFRMGAYGLTFKRTGSARQTDRPDNGGDGVHETLGGGRNVLGVSNAPERYLPTALVATADIRIDLKAPGPRVLRQVIRSITPGRIGSLPPIATAGLPFDTLAACLRPDTAKRNVERLVAASRTLTQVDPGLADVPLIRDARGYEGGAWEWGMSVVEAVERCRANGSNDFSSLESPRIILGGPPGCGKTVFARTVAKSASLPLHIASVGAWFTQGSGYLGDVIRAIDMTFTQATAAGPAVLLLDEIDAIPDRSTVDARHRDFWVTVVSYILTLLDGASANRSSALIIIATTNYPERLDAALTRPGRLSKVVRIGHPSIPAIAGILRQHLGDDLPGVDLASIATVGDGATGADIAGWARNARQVARGANRPMVLDDLVQQVAPPETRDPAEVMAVARHEIAHAVAQTYLRAGTISTVSVVEQGNFSGKTMTMLRATSSLNASQLDALIVSTLVGRAADEHWGAATIGSAGGPGSDLAMATAYVAGKIGCWGLGGSLAYRGDRTAVLELVRENPVFLYRVERELDRLYLVASAFVAEHATLIDRLAQHLVEARVLSGDVIRRLMAEHACEASPIPCTVTVGQAVPGRRPRRSKSRVPRA